MTLVATPGAANANSYVDLATAASYLTTARLYVTAWTGAADDATRERALIWSTALLDRCVEWYGIKRTAEQSLRWPRAGVYDSDGFAVDPTTIPAVLAQATAVFAAYLLTRDRLAEPDLLGLGLSQVGGKVAVTIDPAQVLSIVPREVVLMLSPLGHVRSTATGNGVRQVRVRRV